MSREEPLKSDDDNYTDLLCSIDNPEDCDACGS
jgi:hypothetical protein